MCSFELYIGFVPSLVGNGEFIRSPLVRNGSSTRSGCGDTKLLLIALDVTDDEADP